MLLAVEKGIVRSVSKHPASHQALQILAIAPDEASPLVGALRTLGTVKMVDHVSKAVAALRDEVFDYVVAPTGTLASLDAGGGRGSAESILDRIGQGVCIVDHEGTLVWSNRQLKSYPADAVEKIRETCFRIFQHFAADPTNRDPSRTRRRNVTVDDNLFLELTGSPVFDAQGKLVEVVGLLWDASATRRLQGKINAIDAAGRELVRLDGVSADSMTVADRLELLEKKIINVCRDLMHFDHFAVRVLDKQTNRLDTVIASGFSEEAKSLDILAAREGNGISGFVAATGRSYICPDVVKDPRYLAGIENARSTLTVPLWLHDQVIGILNVESNQIAAFSEDDRQFAEIFGRYVAMALHILKLLVVERHATTGQIASDVAAGLAAPLNDIITEATTIMEEFIGHDELRKRLHSVIDNVDMVKRTLHQLTEPQGVKGLIPEAPNQDPLINGRRILIAEDEEVIRDTVAEILTKLGAVTVTARDGDDAIAMVHGQHFDLVLSDIKMPNKTGYEVFAETKKICAECPVVLITGFGYDPDHSIVRASREGLAGVLFKPFKVEQLLEIVRGALADAPH